MRRRGGRVGSRQGEGVKEWRAARGRGRVFGSSGLWGSWLVGWEDGGWPVLSRWAVDGLLLGCYRVVSGLSMAYGWVTGDRSGAGGMRG